MDVYYLKQFGKYLNWSDISANQLMTEKNIRQFKDQVDWNNITRRQLLTLDKDRHN